MKLLLKLFFMLTMIAVILPLASTFSGVTFYSFDVPFFLLIFLFFFYSLSKNKKHHIKWSNNETYIMWAIALMSIGVLLSNDIVHSMNAYLVWVRLIVFYIIVKRLVLDLIINQRTITVCFFILFGILITIGLLQIITKSEIGLISNYFGIQVDRNVDYIGWRVTGTTRNANVFSYWVIIFSIFINSWMLFKVRSNYKYVLLLLLVVLESVVVFSTLSRAGVGCFVAGSGILAVLWMRAEKKNGVVIAVIATLVVFMFSLSLSLLSSDLLTVALFFERFGESGGQRSVLANLAFNLLLNIKILLFGVGVGTFFPALDHYGISYLAYSEWKDLSDSYSGVHNFFLAIMVENGVVVFLLMLAGYISVMIKVCKMSMVVVRVNVFRNAYIVHFLTASILSFFMFPLQFSNVILTINMLPILAVMIVLSNSHLIRY